MPNIKPVSDLRNYSDVLHDVTALDMQDFEKMQATLRVMNELAKGRKSGDEKGWLTLENVEKQLGIINEYLLCVESSRSHTEKLRKNLR